LCLFLNKQVFTKIKSCLIILSKCQDLDLFWGSVYSGRHVVDSDFQPLGLKSDRKEGGGGGHAPSTGGQQTFMHLGGCEYYINPKPDGMVANMTSKTKNCSDKFSIHKKM
jgi:hypothetical protein